jgi:hypothetical protein
MTKQEIELVQNLSNLLLPGVTRIEVIDHQGQEGRVYTKRDCEKVELSIQDEGRTLKVFISKNIKD